MKRLGAILATAGGVGYIPVAPGTFGAALGVLWHLLFRRSGVPVELVALIGLSGVGIWAAHVTARSTGREDPSFVVIDEVAGQAVALAALNAGPLGLLAGFVLFRAFDILKPWPVRQLESLHGGLGIMADDLMAGVYAWIVLEGLILWHPEMF